VSFSRIAPTICFLSIVIAANASSSRTVALSALLAPIQEVAEAKATVPLAESPAEEKIRHSYKLITLEDVLGRLEHQLAAEVKASSEVSLSSRFNWSGFKVRDDRDWDVRLTTPFIPARNGRWYPSFELIVDGAVVSEYRIPIQVAHFKEVWSVDQNVTKGAAVSETSCLVVIRDIYEERVPPIEADATLEHYEFARALSRGRILTWDDLEERPQVRKNAIVDVEFTKGALEIKMRGRAMDNGMMGDLVTIRNLDTSREFIASVKGENLVQFEL